MSYIITGLDVEEFQPLFHQPEEELQKRGIVRVTADAKPGYPCRITLEDAEPGETLLLLNYASHKVDTPYRSSYAIYVRENATKSATFHNEAPPVTIGRPIALRIFDKAGMLIGADLSIGGDIEEKIENALANPDAEYIHAHNAKPGCFSAEIRRAP